MSSSRKICLYRNCEKDPGSTLFKFPLEKERFTTWCVNAGIALQGEVDISEMRYLCEQHFSAKYINKQSRRKMLVHTAVPKKWKSDINEAPQFTIVGSQPDKKRKFPSITLADVETNKQLELPSLPNETTVRRLSNRLLESNLASSIEASDVNEVQEDEEHIEEFVETQSKMVKMETSSPNNDDNYIEVAQPRRSRIQYIVVKPKAKAPNAPRILNAIHVLNSQVSNVKEIYENYEQAETETPEEIADISSTNIEASEEEKTPDVSIKSIKTDELENCSEFIFNGEKYVQMPKRVFEAEKERVRKESDRCKQLLRKLKQHLNNMDLE